MQIVQHKTTHVLFTVAGALSAAAASMTLFAAPALAQQAAAEDNGVIIVTAQKREENLQTVPAAVSVISADLIERSGAVNIEGLQSAIPTLNFRKGGTTLNSSLFLRGVGTINFSIAAEPSVSTVLDGVVYARSGEAFGDLVDIERIEVLRGPQGTLFGKNASAGVVNVVSKRPGSTFGVEAELSAFTDNEYKAKASVDAPLSPTLRTRLTAFAGSYGGNIENITTGKSINGYDRWGLRGIAVWDASEKLQVTVIGDYRKADDNCCAEVIGTAPSGANGAALTGLLAGVRFQGDETRQVRHNLVTKTEETSWGLSAQADYEWRNHTLTSITAYRSWDNTEVREGDWLDRAAAYVGTGFAQLHDRGPQESTTLTQEFRITSPAGERLEYVGGLFYYRAEAERTFRRDVTSCTASTLAIDATGQRPCTPAASTIVSAFSQANFGSTFENWAAYGQGSFALSDTFKLIAGLRYTSDKLDYFHNRIPSAIAGLPGIRTDTTGFTGNTDETNLSGKVGAQWQATDDIMAYATYSRGYKGPAFNVFFNMNPTQRNVIEAETADAYEAGLKTAWFDNRLIANVAAYYARYENFQANNFDVLNGVVITRLTNAGEVSTKGAELDFSLRPGAGWTINGGLAYTDAQIETFRDAAGVITAARKGEPLPLAPDWKGTLGVEYFLPLGEGVPFDLRFNTQYAYTSDQNSDLGRNPLLQIGATGIWDASLALVDRNERYTLTFIAKNLTDQSYTSLITPGGPGGSLRYLIPREADSYVGVALRTKLGE